MNTEWSSWMIMLNKIKLLWKTCRLYSYQTSNNKETAAYHFTKTIHKTSSTMEFWTLNKKKIVPGFYLSLTSPFISPSPVIWCIVKPSFPKFTWNFENFRTVKFIKTKSKFEADLLGRSEWKRWRYFQFVWFETYFRLILTVWILNKQNMIAHIDKHMANRSHTVNLQLSLVTSLSP